MFDNDPTQTVLKSWGESQKIFSDALFKFAEDFYGNAMNESWKSTWLKPMHESTQLLSQTVELQLKWWSYVSKQLEAILGTQNPYAEWWGTEFAKFCGRILDQQKQSMDACGSATTGYDPLKYLESAKQFNQKVLMGWQDLYAAMWESQKSLGKPVRGEKSPRSEKSESSKEQASKAAAA